MDKRVLREKFLSLRDSISKNHKKCLDKKILKQLGETDLYKKSKKIFTYVSFNNETDTIEFIKKSLFEKKQVYVPYILNDKKSMLASRIFTFNDLKPGKFNILTTQEQSSIINKHDLDLIIVPGLSFDLNGNRLGYGGGYYDRFLESIPSNTITIGICYSFQLSNNIETNEYDIPVQFILTEKGLITCN